MSISEKQNERSDKHEAAIRKQPELSGFVGLANVVLNRAGLTSLADLKSLTRVTHLDVSNNGLQTLVGCPASVLNLRVSNNPLKTLEGGSQLLESLGCSYTHLRNFTGLNCQGSLRTLVCAFALVDSFDGLTECKVLEKCYLSYNRIKSCIGCPAAKYLDLSCNQIQSLRGLPNGGISELCVANNLLTTVDFCPNSATHLRMSGNQIASIPANVLPARLRLLTLNQNRVSDLSNLPESLAELFIADNPIDLRRLHPNLLAKIQDS